MRKYLVESKKSINFASQLRDRVLEDMQMVPCPSGEVPVCKTVHSGSNPLGTSKAFRFYREVFLHKVHAKKIKREQPETFFRNIFSIKFAYLEKKD